MKILFFTEISPFPINGGERIRSYGLLKALSELGHHVDAIIGNINETNLDNYALPNVNYYTFIPKRKTLFQNLFLSHYFTKDKSLVDLIIRIITKNNPNIALIDYGFLGQYISLFRKNGIPVIYGTHNAQSEIIKQLPTKGFVRKIRQVYNTQVEQFHEKFYFKKAQLLITVSSEDKEFHSKFYPVNNIFVIPNFLDESLYRAKYKRENYFVMTANFNAYQNLEGIRWFLDSIWDNELDKKHKLLIVGKGSDMLQSKIPKLANFSNVHIEGPVENIVPYIAKAKAVIIPLLHGSGSRLKCLEAMALGTPIISTSKGIEGISSKFITVSNSNLEFKNSITNFTYHLEASDSIKKEFYSSYSLTVNKNRIEKILDLF